MDDNFQYTSVSNGSLSLLFFFPFPFDILGQSAVYIPTNLNLNEADS